MAGISLRKTRGNPYPSWRVGNLPPDHSGWNCRQMLKVLPKTSSLAPSLLWPNALLLFPSIYSGYGWLSTQANSLLFSACVELHFGVLCAGFPFHAQLLSSARSFWGHLLCGTPRVCFFWPSCYKFEGFSGMAIWLHGWLSWAGLPFQSKKLKTKKINY